MTADNQHRFTVKDYYRMGEAGVLRPDARVELLDGKIFDVLPIRPFHSGVIIRLLRLFSEFSRDRWLVSAHNPVHLDEYSEPKPDLMLLKPDPDDYTNAHPAPDDVFLLIEVADSSLNFDRGEKIPAYGRAGISEVWIINLSARTIEIYREPHFTGYEICQTLRAGEKVSPRAFPDVELEVAELLKLAK